MLTFDSELHEYRWNGAPVPSVTQILEDVGIVDYSYIPLATREMALKRGSAVHAATHFDDEGDLDESTISPVLLPYLLAWRRFLRESGFVVEEIEKRNFNQRWGYAGTRDRRGKLNGLPTVLDIKTNQAPDWVRMQLAAYCEFEQFPTTIGRAAVELHADETYRLIQIPISRHAQDFNDFCCALRVYQLKREHAGSKERRNAA